MRRLSVISTGTESYCSAWRVSLSLIISSLDGEGVKMLYGGDGVLDADQTFRLTDDGCFPDGRVDAVDGDQIISPNISS